MEMALPTEDNGTKLKFEAWDPLNTSLTIPHNACKHGWCLVGWLWAVLGVVVQYFCYLCISLFDYEMTLNVVKKHIFNSKPSKTGEF